MDFDNTIQAMQSMGFQVVKQGKRILRKKKKRTKSAGLEKGFNYNVNKSKTGVELEFVFGKAKKYWQFVDEGVRGKGGYKGKGGRGRARGQGSPFRFKKNNIKRGVIKKWIKRKRIRLRGAKGKFIKKTANNIRNAAFVIGRAIALRGLTRTQFFTQAYEKQWKININKITNAYAEDVAQDAADKMKKHKD